MNQVRVWEQLGLVFTILFFWLIGNEDLLLLRHFAPAEWINLAFTAMVVYLMWGLFRLILQQLHGLRLRYPNAYYYGLQVFVSTALLLPFLYFLNYLYIYHYWEMTFEENYFREVIFPLGMLCFLLWNAIDFMYHLHTSGQQAEAVEDLHQKESRYILVRSAKEMFKLPLNNIAYITVQHQLTRLITMKGEAFILSEPLVNLEGQLPETTFFRVNRQSIIARAAVQRVRRIGNQKLALDISPSTQWLSDCTVSRYKAGDFLEWWKEDLRYSSPKSNHSAQRPVIQPS